VAGDIHLKIDGVDGESTIKGFEKQIDITSFQLGAHMQGTGSQGGGMSAGKVSYSDVVITKMLDKASPMIFQKCSKGDHIPSALLSFKKAGGKAEEYLKIKLEDLLITSISVSGSDGGGNPMESVSMHFDKITMDYKEQKADGTLGGAASFTHSIKQNA
jgi:type VI secretion system secreted protein Hcp